jgi:hypothetical protein
MFVSREGSLVTLINQPVEKLQVISSFYLWRTKFERK